MLDPRTTSDVFFFSFSRLKELVMSKLYQAKYKVREHSNKFIIDSSGRYLNRTDRGFQTFNNWSASKLQSVEKVWTVRNQWRRASPAPAQCSVRAGGRARWARGESDGAQGIWRHPGGGTRTNGQRPHPHLVTPEPIPIPPNLQASTPPCPICSAATSSPAISLSRSTRRVHPFLTAPVGRPVQPWGERASEPRVPSSRRRGRGPAVGLRLGLELTAFRASWR